MSAVSDRINMIAKNFGFSKYLEIGVYRGDTFFKVDMNDKYAVDPCFQFEVAAYDNKKNHFYSMCSDDFFNKLKKDAQLKSIKFDIIYIDGMHTFMQSYKDFLQSLNFAHDKTIWIFDDTVPPDPYAAIPVYSTARKYRQMCNFRNKCFWTGDVFKTIFAIHSLHPDYSYVTQMDKGNPQTIVWKNDIPTFRKPLYKSINDIDNLSYFDLLENCYIHMPILEKELMSKIYDNINPENFKNDKQIEMFIKNLDLN